MSAEPKSPHDDIQEVAAAWYARLDSGSADRVAFEAWRDADPRHASAFAQVHAAMRQMEKLRGLTAPPPPLQQPTRRSFLTSGKIAAGLVAIVGIAGITAIGAGAGRARAETVVGERKTVALPYGDRLELNTDSKAEWRSSRETRELWLKRGEVAVKVTQGSKPFTLRAGKHVVQLGTGEYIARLRATSLDLISLAGTARIDDGGKTLVEVRPQQAAILTGTQDRVRPVSSDDIHFLTGWRQDELVLNGQVLSEVVEEYNRYLDRKIIIADPEIGGLQLGGRFTNRDPSKLLAGLEASFGIHVTQESHSVILSK